MPIERITTFKVNSDADVDGLIAQYQTVKETNQKDGKPYILFVTAYRPIDDPRAQGFNVVAHTKFESMEDVKFYDEQCEAHQGVKDFAKGKVAGPPLSLMWETK